MPRLSVLLAALLAATSLGSPGRSQESVSRPVWWVVPQSRSYRPATPPTEYVAISRVEAGVVVEGRVATTTLDVSLVNPMATPQEARLLVPVPDGAVVRGFEFAGSASEPTARLLPREEAERIYRDIVAKMRDPALLEFAGLGAVESSVFPVPANGEQKVRLTYEHIVSGDSTRVDYVLPRSESLDVRVPWKVTVSVRAEKPISTVYSPSHPIDTRRIAKDRVAVRTTDAAATDPGSFRLSWLYESPDAPTASIFAYPDAKIGGGYFLLLAGLPLEGPELPMKRDLTLVIDRSGSMKGKKIEQAKEAARQILGALEEGEYFNVITYADTVESFAPCPIPKTAESAARCDEFIQGITALSGTNLHDALVTALVQQTPASALPLVLFLTDGLPTVGVTSEAEILAAAKANNTLLKRVFTFGVGFDVNAPLLGRLARDTRATTTVVMPDEDVEVKVAQVFRRLSGPVLAEPRLEVVGPDGQIVTDRTSDLVPGVLSDLFEGDQVVVLGRYKGTDDLRFRIAGFWGDAERSYEYRFGLGDVASHAFVPRLWASRKIGVLVEAITALGVDSHGALASAGGAAQDPRLKELTDEIIRLSKEFGVLTEYTAFLAMEGTDLSDSSAVLSTATENFVVRALQCRTGVGAVNQLVNNDSQRQQSSLNGRNRFYDASFGAVELATVCQVSDRALFRRGGRWIEGNLLDTATDEVAAAATPVDFGTPVFDELFARLVGQGRQAILSLRGEVLFDLDGTRYLVRGFEAPAPEPSPESSIAPPVIQAPSGAANGIFQNATPAPRRP